MFVVAAAVATVAWQLSGHAVTDIPLYRTYGERVARGLVPYRDFAFEYPPGALPALVLPALVTDSLAAYRVVFAAEMAIAGAMGVLLLAAALAGSVGRGPSDGSRSSVVALVPLLLGGVILTRFDLVPAALVAGALLLLAAGRLRRGAVVVGIGIAVKLYPAVLVPLLAVAGWRAPRPARARRRSRARRPAGRRRVPAVPARRAGRRRSTRSAASSAARSRSRASAPGVLLALHHVFGHAARLVVGERLAEPHGHGRRRRSPCSRASPRSAAVALVWLVVRARAGDGRAPRPPRGGRGRRLRRAQQGALAAVPRLARAARAARRRRAKPRRALVLTVVACALTAVWFPARYWELVREFDPLASWLVLARG